jgi:hypothetical protein
MNEPKHTKITFNPSENKVGELGELLHDEIVLKMYSN